MNDFLTIKLPYDLSSHAGPAFVSKYLKRINLKALVDPVFPFRSGVANSDIFKSHLVLQFRQSWLQAAKNYVKRQACVVVRAD